jgi:predicted nuclease of predicted toxin-antitoxin system
MLKIAVDENFDNDILKELLRQRPELDVVRVQDVGLISADDPPILEWAAQESRILLTHE